MCWSYKIGFFIASPYVSQKSLSHSTRAFFILESKLKIKNIAFKEEGMKIFLVCLSLLVSFKCWSNPEVRVEQGYFFKTITTQIGLYFYQDEKTLLGFKAGQGEEEDSFEKEKQFNFSIDYKKFESETFYVGTTLSYYYYFEDKKEEDVVLDIFDPQDDFHAVGLTLRIGNEWKLGSHFSIGCDWIGIGYGRIVSNRADNNNDTNIHFVLLNLHLGYRF